MNDPFLADFAERLRGEIAWLLINLDNAEKIQALTLAYDSLPVALDEVEAGG